LLAAALKESLKFMVLIANIPQGDNYYKFTLPQPPLAQLNAGVRSLKFLAMVEVELT
jgi:hypothetical protein